MNSFILGFKNYATFSGRTRRKDYWMFILFSMLAFFVTGLIDTQIIGFPILTLIYALAVIIPSWAVMFRRLHDTGRSGAWFLISLVPFVGGIILLVFLCQDSQKDANEFGSNPKAFI